MKPKPAFACPNCRARLVVPVRTDGTYSPDMWLCTQCNKFYTADFIDDYRKSQREDKHHRAQDSARPKRQPNLL